MSAPQIQPEKPEDTWSISDWKETVEFAKPGNGVWSQREQQDTIVIEFPANKLRSAISQIFGFSQCNPSSQNLKRVLPIQHPVFNWLWADSGSSSIIGPVGNSSFLNSHGNPTPKLESLSDYNTPEYYVRYNIVKLAVVFKPFSGLILADDDESWSGKESDRFIGTKQIQPNLELMTAQTLSGVSPFRFADQDGGYPSIGTSGTEFTGSVYVRKATTNYQLEWINVEESYLCDTSYDNYFIMPYPKKLINYLGYLNETTFAGHAPGTLLFNGIQAVRYPQPVKTVGDYNLWAWDLLLNIQQFDPQDPPRGVGSTVVTSPPGETPKRGHLLMPSRQKLGWFYATRSNNPNDVGTYNGDGILPLVDFEKLFEYWDA
jgi:hypothetical protein